MDAQNLIIADTCCLLLKSGAYVCRILLLKDTMVHQSWVLIKMGVQAKIKQKYPNATYVHCSHVLNLSVSSGCNDVPLIRNLFDNVQKLTLF